MEDLILRFPHISKQIFANLCNQDLTKSREVCKLWCQSIDTEKTLWLRRIKEYIPDPQEFHQLWARVLHTISTEHIQELAYAVQSEGLHIPAEPIKKKFWRNQL